MHVFGREKNGTQACKKMPAPSLPNQPTPHPVPPKMRCLCIEPARAIKASAAGPSFSPVSSLSSSRPRSTRHAERERGDAGFRVQYTHTRGKTDRPATLARSAGRSTRGLLTHTGGDRERRGGRSNGRRGCLLLPLFPFFLRFFP